MPSSASRVAAGPPASPAVARPETSPFTSAAKTGTPAADSCSASSCSVLVLPVPVAPAISPWRLTIDSGTRTAASCTSCPSWTPRPRSSAGPSNVYAFAIAAPKSPCFSVVAMGGVYPALAQVHRAGGAEWRLLGGAQSVEFAPHRELRKRLRLDLADALG